MNNSIKLNFDKPINENEIFVKNTQPFRVYIKRIFKLFLKGENEIIIKGLSASIKKCLKLADKSKNSFSDINIEIDSETIDCVTKIIKEEEEFIVKKKSLIIIKLIRNN